MRRVRDTDAAGWRIYVAYEQRRVACARCRGVTVERLDGFGEIFRYLTYQEIGSPAIISRATAGIVRGRVIFSMPGSEHAVRLAMEKLILPELGHLVKELTK